MSKPTAVKSFTTEPKGHKRKGHSPIRQRCMEFINFLKALGYTRQLPLKEAKELFFQHLGLGDPKTVKQYFGVQGTKRISKMQRIARYSSGTCSYKNIELAYSTPSRKGYFERLGLAKVEQRGDTWFFMIEKNVLVPVLGSHTEERVCGSIDNFSLSVRQEGGEAEEISGLDVVEKINKHTPIRVERDFIFGLCSQNRIRKGAEG